MKALLLATFILTGEASQPVRTVTSNVLSDQSQCSSAMMSMVEHAGLKNHLKSSGPNHIRARKDGRGTLGAGTSIEVTCKPIKGE